MSKRAKRQRAKQRIREAVAQMESWEPVIWACSEFWDAADNSLREAYPDGVKALLDANPPRKYQPPSVQFFNE